MIISQIDLKLKARSEFPNVWGEYKNHTKSYIQGTTVPCDVLGKCYNIIVKIIKGTLPYKVEVSVVIMCSKCPHFMLRLPIKEYIANPMKWYF